MKVSSIFIGPTVCAPELPKESPRFQCAKSKEFIGNQIFLSLKYIIKSEECKNIIKTQWTSSEENASANNLGKDCP